MANMLLKPCWSLLPDDIGHKIASLLEIDLIGEEKAPDVCSLGRCSRFWHEICVSDCLWMDLAKRRSPMLDMGIASPESLQIPCVLYRIDQVEGREIPFQTRSTSSPIQGWREAYIYRHQSLACSVSAVKKFVEQFSQNESLEVGCFLEAVSNLHFYHLGFKDVEVFLFSKSCNVILNLVGLHYCLLRLEIPPSVILEALNRSQISEREICVSWFKLGRWFYGFRLHDEHRTRKISLRELLLKDGEEVLGLLNRGAVHEVIRVHITPGKYKACNFNGRGEH